MDVAWRCQLLDAFDKFLAAQGVPLDDFLSAMAEDWRQEAATTDDLVKALLLSAATQLEGAAMDYYVSTK